MNKQDEFIRKKLQEDKQISSKANTIFDNIKEEFKMENKKVIKISFNKFLSIAASFAIVLFLGIGLLTSKIQKDNTTEVIKTETKENKQAFKYALKSNSLEDFDLRFLQLENERVNKIYSPLSIKYTLGMLNEGTEGETKEQISGLIGEYKSNKYINSKNMAFANSIFIRDTYKENIKETFVSNLKNKYNADVVYDSFDSAEKINSWISDNTLGLLQNMLNNEELKELNLALVNALGIDMDWNEKFLSEYRDELFDYSHEEYSWKAPGNLLSNKFEGIENEVSGMGIIASINNYDIVKTLGEENIRKTVEDACRKYLQGSSEEERAYFLKGKDIETAIQEYLDQYIKEINENYKKAGKSTEFYVYDDENIKAFAKDLKEYNGTTLQYVAIMPEENLSTYIDNITANDINQIIENLKELKSENFKEGVVTEIVGYIPKFKFNYELDLIKDLNDMGVKDVFDRNKCNIKGITDDENLCISNAKHKSNIEFTQDGIKATAATFLGGTGGGANFDYYYDIPVERIDLTFDKPYMFLIRDKKTGEIWFVGTVYEPLSIEDEPEINNTTSKEFEERNITKVFRLPNFNKRCV